MENGEWIYLGSGICFASAGLDWGCELKVCVALKAEV